MSDTTKLYEVKSVIRIIRNQRVILDSDLARLYGVTTKRLNEAVKRNLKRFPPDFMFQLDTNESAYQRLQNVNPKKELIENQEVTSNWSQIATSSSKHRGTTYLPYAFTEHGIIMVASVLNSDKAIEMSVFIARTFVRMREQLMANVANAKRLAEIEKTLLTHDSAIVDLYEQIQPLLLPPPAPNPKRIGFGVKEKRMSYRVAKNTQKGGSRK
jgi:phage regulator Rha-like protein